MPVNGLSGDVEAGSHRRVARAAAVACVPCKPCLH